MKIILKGRDICSDYLVYADSSSDEKITDEKYCTKSGKIKVRKDNHDKDVEEEMSLTEIEDSKELL